MKEGKFKWAEMLIKIPEIEIIYIRKFLPYVLYKDSKIVRFFKQLLNIPINQFKYLYDIDFITNPKEYYRKGDVVLCLGESFLVTDNNGFWISVESITSTEKEYSLNDFIGKKLIPGGCMFKTNYE